MKLPKGLETIKQVVKRWGSCNGAGMGAALSYYTVFSLAPILLIALAVAGLIFDREAVRASFLTEFSRLLGERGSELISTVIDATLSAGGNTVATTIGVITLIIGALSVFGELRRGLNRMMGFEPVRGTVPRFFLSRLASFGMVLTLGFLALVSLLINAALSALAARFGLTGTEASVLAWLYSLLVVVLMAGLFALIFRFLPAGRLPWKAVIRGAIVTALLFTVGKFLIGLYLGSAAVADAYGAAGSVITLLLWTYYSAQILYLGAAYTFVEAQRQHTFLSRLFAIIKKILP